MEEYKYDAIQKAVGINQVVPSLIHRKVLVQNHHYSILRYWSILISKLNLRFKLAIVQACPYRWNTNTGPPASHPK